MLYDDRKFKVEFTLIGSDKVHTEIIPIDEEYGVVPGAYRELNKKYNNKVDLVLDFDLIEEDENMICPKCGKVLQETNDGSFICTPECGYLVNAASD